jgi:hypothetical protein
MALDISKFSEVRVLDKLENKHVIEVNNQVIKWLHDNVGNMTTVKETYFIPNCAAIHYRGDGWQIEPPTGSMRVEQGYRITIVNDTLALQFKLTWL